MELHYYKHIEEAEEYLTWKFVIVDIFHRGQIVGTEEKGWIKKQPEFSSKLEAATWYSMSNMEDKHFIEMERMYCNKYLDKELKDIERSEPYNKKVIEDCKIRFKVV